MKKIKFVYTGITIATIVFMIGCTKKVADPPKAEPAAVDCNTITYSNYVKPLVAESCAKGGCHDAATKAGSVELTTYAQLKAQVDAGRIKARVIDGIPSHMPLDKGKLPDIDIQKIQCWLNSGAPNN